MADKRKNALAYLIIRRQYGYVSHNAAYTPQNLTQPLYDRIAASHNYSNRLDLPIDKL